MTNGEAFDSSPRKIVVAIQPVLGTYSLSRHTLPSLPLDSVCVVECCHAPLGCTSVLNALLFLQ